MELFTLSQLVQITQAVPCCSWDKYRKISGISIDTRSLAPGELFIGLQGTFFNGADFIDEAFSAGASSVIIGTQEHSKVSCSHSNVFSVPSPLRALQSLAQFHRKSFPDLSVIGITGSNGKTAVKDMMTSILSSAGYTVHATSGSRNSQIGVPLTLLDLRPGHEIAVIEAGISRVGEMEFLRNMIAPTTGLITLIGDAHAEFLGGGPGTAREKSKLFENIPHSGIVALPGEDHQISYLKKRLSCMIKTFGFAQDNDVYARHIKREDHTITFNIHWNGRSTGIRINSMDKTSVLNALCASTVALCSFGVSLGHISEGLSRYIPPPMRLELSETDNGVALLNDAYVADPVSMRRALRSLVDLGKNRRKIAVLGDMAELGELSEDAHRTIGATAAKIGIDFLITVGAKAEFISNKALIDGFDPRRVFHCKNAQSAAELLTNHIRSGDMVLLKGSRALKLERVARNYVSSLRPTRLIIDLDAVASNARTLRSIVSPEVKICGVIKSHGYGLDSRRIADVCIKNGVDWLAVAIPDEGVRLRNAGITSPILVLGGTLPEEADKVVAHNLSQVVTTRDLARALAEEAGTRKKKIENSSQSRYRNGAFRITTA